MKLFKVKGYKDKIIVDYPKALLLNDYLKRGYISLNKETLVITIESNNPIIKHSILKG